MRRGERMEPRATMAKTVQSRTGSGSSAAASRKRVDPQGEGIFTPLVLQSEDSASKEEAPVVPVEGSFPSSRTGAQHPVPSGAQPSKNRAGHTKELLRQLIDAVQDYAVFVLDTEGNVLTWNTGAERMKGYKASEIIGRNFSNFYPEEDIRGGKPQRELEIAKREGRVEDEGWRLRKDGSRFWANVVITALRDDQGRLIGFGKLTRDFTERIRTQEALRAEIAEKSIAQRRLHESESALRRLSLHVLQTQDEERRRIGRELHDSIGQYLSVLKMKLDSMSLKAKRAAATDIARDLADAANLLDQSIKEVRTISYLLYPPLLEEMGLSSAIAWYVDGFAARSGVRTSLEVSEDFGRLPQSAELTLFRILQESLTNVHRHSGSASADIRLFRRSGQAVLEVEDRGSGLPPEILAQAGTEWVGSPGVGLRGMNERLRQLGGKLDIISSSNGTTLIASVPLTDETALK
jgi:PAS domain S-box-containing protein